jgi:hypothetical protein
MLQSLLLLDPLLPSEPDPLLLLLLLPEPDPLPSSEASFEPYVGAPIPTNPAAIQFPTRSRINTKQKTT